MRPLNSLGVFFTSIFLSQSLAQGPEYGNTNDYPNQVSTAGIPGDAPSAPTCVTKDTTTVFVTLSPTSPPDSSDGPPSGDRPGGDQSDNGQPDGANPILTVTKTLNPTTTVFVSAGAPGGEADDPSSDSFPDGSPDDLTWGPISSTGPLPTQSGPFVSAGSPSNADPAIDDSPATVPDKPFTTLTIDIWGTASGTEGDSGKDGSAGPTATPTINSVTASGGASRHHPGNLPTAYGDPDGSSLHPGGGIPVTTGENGQGSRDTYYPQYTVVTDTDIFWTTGTQGPSQVTVLFSHTLTIGGGPNTEPSGHVSGADIPSTKTIIGSDGKPTVVVNPSGETPVDNQGIPPPIPFSTVDTPPQSYTPVDDSSPSSSESNSSSAPLNDADSDDGSTTCTTFTVLGADGLPTVVHSTWTLTDGTSILADSFTSPFATEASLTGLPGVTAPGPLPTLGPFSTPGSPTTGNDIVSTTCVILTTTGSDGIATVFESTVVVPAPTELSKTLPTAPPTVSDVPQGVPGDEGVTSCLSYTITGLDGFPTVFESTTVLPPFDTISSAPGVSQRLPGDGGAPGSFSFTITGADGLPTVFETTNPTYGISGDAGGQTSPVIIQASLSGFPPSVSDALPTGIPATNNAQDGAGNDVGVTTCKSFTYLGDDGLATVFETAWTVANQAQTQTGLPSALSGASNVSPVNGAPWPMITPPGTLPPAISGIPSGLINSGITTCTSYTVLGSNGRPTVVDSTWVIQDPLNTQESLSQVPSITTPLTIPEQVTGISDLPGNGSGSAGGGETTCASYTVLGSDGRLTVIDTTWTIPSPMGTQESLPQLPSGVVPSDIPGQITGIPVSPGSGGPAGAGEATVCTSYTLIGADGAPIVVETTWTIPSVESAPPETLLGFPSAVPRVSWLPSDITRSPVEGEAITTPVTTVSFGPDGLPMPVVQTVVFTPGSIATTAGIPSLLPAGPVVSGALPGQPSPSGYGAGLSSGLPAVLPPSAPNFTPILSGSAVIPGSGIPPPVITGTAFNDPANEPAITNAPDSLPPPYGDSLSNGIQFPGQIQEYEAQSNTLPTEVTLWGGSMAYGGPSLAVPSPAVSSPCTTTVLRTSTWTNVIAEETTTYTFEYQVTTIATVTTPVVTPGVGRVVRRQESSVKTSAIWANSSSPAVSSLTENTSIGASLSSALDPSSPMPDTPFTASPATSGTPSPTMPSPGPPTLCTAGGKVGNSTMHFDDIESGPLNNPVDDLWFSQGFSVVPPSSQPGFFLPSSGGQLIKFVPPSLSPSLGEGSGDTAEIGVGPHFASPCFKFNFYGASLGCAAGRNEQWCEFEISAYTYDEEIGASVSVPWSETKRVPTCPSYPSGECSLTQIDLEGYTNVTSILITLRVGLDLRIWWGDDIRIGWADNSCEAARCRADSPHYISRRETPGAGFRRRFWDFLPAIL